ncbi:NAD(P)H-dependent oxidoreductase [Methylobacterium nodulans]|uniref:NAD(P)H-dependent oxidoreductase n=1 Tax=Methylobacterium nodulans TaxID=114616 RepID=UPI000312516B
MSVDAVDLEDGLRQIEADGADLCHGRLLMMRTSGLILAQRCREQGPSTPSGPAIEGADGLIVGSPVYKGSYSGLFKHVIDFLAPEALAGKPVAIAATGGGARHALMVEHQLRPLFGFFTAHVAPTAVYAGEAEIQDGVVTDPGVAARVVAAATELAHLLDTAEAARRARTQPPTAAAL